MIKKKVRLFSSIPIRIMKKIYNVGYFIILGYGISFFISIVFTMLKIEGNIIVEQYIEENALLIMLNVLILSPAIEELVFRGIIYKLIMRNLLKLCISISAIISSAIFGALHYFIPTIIVAIIFGMVQCYIYEKKNKIIYCMLIHFGFNLYSFIAIFVDQYIYLAFSMFIILMFIYDIAKRINGKSGKCRKNNT